MGRDNALFVYTHPSTFVRADISVLQTKYNVKEYHFKNNPKHRLPLSLLHQLLFLLFSLHKYKLVYIWFADYHSFLPTLASRILKRKCILVVGGYDVCREKQWNYGSLTKPLRAFMAIKSINLAGTVLCVSKNLERIVKSIAPDSNVKLLYNGVISSKEQINPRSNGASVLCVALVSSIQAYYIKGIDRYCTIALRLPQINFTLVGCNPAIFEKVATTIPPNLEVVPYLSHNKLLELYPKHNVYCQFSRRESFSLSLAEAMLNNLVPITSTAGGMPEVTGKHGYNIYMSDSPMLKEEGLEKATNAVKEAIYTHNDSISQIKSQNSIEFPNHRILQYFTIHKRSDGLLKLLSIQE